MSHKRGPIIEALRTLVHSLASAPFTGKVLDSLSKERFHAITMKAERTLRAHGYDHVIKGPFAGLKYPELHHDGYTALVYKFLGVFETELHETLADCLTRPYSTVLNIGAADGYYAAGFAKFIPSAHVVAWEMDPFFQGLLQLVCKANGVQDRVEVRGYCSTDELRSIRTTGRTLIFSDCEGGEVALLTKENLQALEVYDIIVECHDHFVADATSILQERFKDSHEITSIETRLRTLSEIPPELVTLLGGPSDDLVHIIEEPRHYKMHWLYMIDKRK